VTDPVNDVVGELGDDDPDVRAGMARLAELRAAEDDVVDVDAVRRRT